MNINSCNFLYQPIVKCNEKPSCFFLEALIRPNDINGNQINPIEYIKVIDDKISFDLNVIKKVLQETEGYKFLVSINIFTPSLINAYFVESLIEIAKSTKVKFSLELTEHFHIEEDQMILISKNVKRLKSYGIMFSLDDFGAAYSSEKIMFYVDFDFIKLDMFYVDNIADDALKFNLLLNTVIKISNTYNSSIIIEGVEDEITATIISHISKITGTLLMIQGYFFYRPSDLSTFKDVDNYFLQEENFCNQKKICEEYLFLKVKYSTEKKMHCLHKTNTIDAVLSCIKELILLHWIGGTYIERRITSLIDKCYSVSLSEKSDFIDEIFIIIKANLDLGDKYPILNFDKIILNSLEHSKTLCAIRDKFGNHIYANKEYDDFFGMKTKGVNIHDLYKIVPLASANAIQICIEHDELVVKSKDPLSATEVFTIDGKELVFETNRECIFVDNDIYVYITAKDITNSLIEDLNGNLFSKNYIDPLTKVFNRHYLEELDSSGFKSLIFLDLDGFKLANDLKGHEYGDLVLRTICLILSRNFRHTDPIIRIGGDEICIITSLICNEDLEIRVLSIRDEFELSCEGVSFSYGLSPIVNNDLEEALLNGDKLMYENKRLRKDMR